MRNRVSTPLLRKQSAFRRSGLGARVIGPSLAAEVMQAFLGAQFSNLERHVRRLNKVKKIESDALSGAWNPTKENVS